MEDLFYREEQILHEAHKHISEVSGGAPVNCEFLKRFIREYGVMLRHLRRVISISEKTSEMLISEQKFILEKINELEYKVHYDSLTGILNRRYMEGTLNKIIKTLKRLGGGMLSVMMLDIDFFKNYNDTYGHAGGDICLRAIAKAIESSLSRADDFVARYGGEEFVVVLPNTSENGARIMAERILKNVREQNIPHERSEAAPCVTISIGVVSGDVRNINNGLDYIKRADEALYDSKRNGRNKYTYYDFVI